MFLTHHSGIIGLNSQPLNFSTLGNETSASFVTALKDANKIPDISWSYTAGAKYRESAVPDLEPKPCGADTEQD